jgi:serine/threonine protein kinase
VHRDVKPGNVMLCPAPHGGRIKLLDFGVAKVEAQARRHVAPIVFPTHEGLCVGTPRYVSPEQASGLDVDRRTDIYAAGMLLYRMIAGRGPFDDIVGARGLLEAHVLREPAPPSHFMSASLAPRVEAVILRAIAKNPADRFVSAAAFSRELGQAWSKVRGSRRERAVQRIALPVRYAHRPSVQHCRIRAVSAAPSRAAYRASPICPTEEEVTPSIPPARADAIPVVWSSAFTVFRPAPSRFRPPISRRGVFCSAAAFFAVAGSLAMWFVR